MAMIKKAASFLVILLIGAIAFSPGAFADPISIGDIIRLGDKEGTTGGGEFSVQKQLAGNTWSTDLFRTFCMERAEYISFGTQYRVGDITEKAIYGGNGPTGDLIDTKTAYLYTMFRLGTLSNYDYTANSQEHIRDANSLQTAIWFIEGEITSLGSNAQAIAWYNEAVAAGWKTIGNVRVMNLYAMNGTRAQDQLILVPEPHTLLLLGIGLVGLAGFGRKKFRK